MKDECEKLGANGVLLLSFDLTDSGSFEEIVAESVCKFGRIDILINNAATVRPGGLESQESVVFGKILLIKSVRQRAARPANFRPENMA